MRFLSRNQKILIASLILIGLFLTGLFGLRTFRSYMRLQQHGLKPGVTDVTQIRGWMTIPYISRAYKVPPAYIFEQIEIPPQGNHKKSLRQLNRKYAPDQPGEIISRVQKAIQQYHDQPPDHE